MGSLQVRAGCLRKHQRGRTFVMQLTTVREIYKNRETFLDKEITVGGWVRSVRDSKTFGLSFCMTEHFLRPYRWYTTILWRTLQRFPD